MCDKSVSYHIVVVCSFYPLYPPHPDVPVDVEKFDVHCRLPVAPHVMVLPSDLRCFIKVECLVLLWSLAICVED